MRRVALLCLAGWGCFPMLKHGPQVKHGGELTVGGVLAVLTADSPTTKVGALPNLDVGFAFGTKPKGWNGGGLRVGGQVGMLYCALDVYHQFSRSIAGSTPAGVGLLLMAGTRTGVMPYAMVGDLFGSHAYLTQGIATVRSTPAAPFNTLSVTTFGIEFSRWDGFHAVFVTVLLGHQTRCFGGGMFCDQFAPVAMVGLTGPLPLPRMRGPRPPGPWPPPPRPPR